MNFINFFLVKKLLYKKAGFFVKIFLKTAFYGLDTESEPETEPETEPELEP